MTDRGCVQAGLLKILTDALKEGDQQYTVFDGVVSNPTTDTVDQALGKFTREKCVSLIGLGGGSSMDCAKAVKLIFDNLQDAYDDGENMEARSNMMEAAYCAGAAFSQSYVGYVHAVAHSLGGQYNIPHGLANAVLLPVVLECYGTAAQKKLHRLAVAAGIAALEDSDAAGSEKFICAVREMNRRLGIPETLPGIKEEDIPMMAAYAAREADPLYPVPVIWGADQLERFYYAVMDRQQISIAMKADRSENNASADKKTAAGS